MSKMSNSSLALFVGVVISSFWIILFGSLFWYVFLNSSQSPTNTFGQCGVKIFNPNHPEIVWYHVLEGENIVLENCGNFSANFNRSTSSVAIVTDEYPDNPIYCYSNSPNGKYKLTLTSYDSELGKEKCSEMPDNWVNVEE